ncbi:MAG TPA: hypothetical protein PLV45_03215 [bacterium]|nr:hypothetical protein [bacterium]
MKTVSMDDLKKHVTEIAHEGKLNCAEALKLAETLGISPRDIGKAANLLNIRISACQLGCFK